MLAYITKTVELCRQPFDGSGGFNRVMNWTNDALANIKILATRHDAEDDNLAAGLSNTLTKDGQSQPTANIGLNGKRLVNVGNPVNPQDAVTLASQGTAIAGSSIRFDAVQALTDAQKGQARANIGADLLAGFRNKIINGDFDIWQRGVSQTAIAYGSDDRWYNANTGSTKTHSQQLHALGQTNVPGNPKYFSRTVVASVANAANNCFKVQFMEGVRTLSGKTATITFWAKADAPKNIAVELNQFFGITGSPSAGVSMPLGLKALTTAWQKFSFTAAVASIAGKTLGSSGTDSLGLYFWFDAGSNSSARASSLGQQSGTFDISHVSVVEGDATAEADPFSPRHAQQELELCKRYYQYGLQGVYGFPSGSCGMEVSIAPWMRGTPTVVRTAHALTSAEVGTVVASPAVYGFMFTQSAGTAVGGQFTADAEL